MNDMRGAALGYASRSWHVFPTEPAGKAPYGPLAPRGLHSATNDPEIIDRWWGMHPECGIAITTGAQSDIVVVDVDPPDGYLSLLNLQRAQDDLPDTLWVRTPRGGWHCYLAHPGERIPNSASKLAPSIDVRGDGGYVLVPPSRTADGEYRWYNPGAPIAPMPAWMVQLLGPQASPPVPIRDLLPAAADRYALAAFKRETADVAAAKPGTRNHRLNAAAFSLGQLVGGRLLGEQDAVSGLLQAAAACGLTEPESRRTIQSGITAGMAQPRGYP